ncbi:hypothetical protein [Vibrio porteresiae]|uniref:Uncharacterized protein n=1 Tax=Vibrio porteresiae DSM 19223 TaxID=1123496 RepID=A0ABZ0QIN9_9VIBR|nr:hypothetical protein [Vibrio porteresiae]WPC75906.1 hypothetical protein R8Z52_23620 [Vibrio porteresiae DSM 19223]
MQYQEVSQKVYYSNKEYVPIGEIAHSLIAFESLIKQAPEVLEALFPDLTIINVEVFIKELRSDSIWEDLVIKLIFGNQQRFDECIDNVRQKLGIEKIMENHPNFLSAVLIAMILAGGAYYLGKSSAPDNKEAKETIEANNNTIIQIGAGMVDMTADEFTSIVISAIKDKEKLAKNSLNVVKPAKLDPNATISFNDDPNLKITSASIKAMPEYKSVSEQEEELVEDFHDVRLELRAIDLDSTKHGWAVVAPSLYKKRVKLQLDPTIKPSDLKNKLSTNGNITVVWGFDKKGNRIPKIIFLREIIN